MTKRFVDTELWQKEWFQTLSIKHKILLKYIFENCDCAGIWNMNFRLASFIIGEKVTLDDIKYINSTKKQFEIIDNNNIFVIDFIKFQYGVLSYSCKPHLPVIKLLKKHGIEFETLDDNDLSVKQQRKRLTQAFKEKIFARDKYKCQYCGSTENLEIDHIIPLSKGGNNNENNLLTACHNCNSLKWDFSIDEFLKRYGNKIRFLDTLSNKLDTLSNNFITLEEKEKEQDKEKEKEKEKEKNISSLDEDQRIYGKYNNVCLAAEQYNRLLAKCTSQKLLDELIDSLSANIETGKEQPFKADFPNAHFIRLEKYFEWRRKHPARPTTRYNGGIQQQIDEQAEMRKIAAEWAKRGNE